MAEESAANSDADATPGEIEARLAGIEVVVEYLDRRVSEVAGSRGDGEEVELERLERRLAALERSASVGDGERLQRRVEALERLEPERGVRQLEDASDQLVRLVTQLTAIGERLDSVEESLLGQPGVAPLVERLAGSVEDLIERVETAAGASGSIAETLAARIERLEGDPARGRVGRAAAEPATDARAEPEPVSEPEPAPTAAPETAPAGASEPADADGDDPSSWLPAAEAGDRGGRAGAGTRPAQRSGEPVRSAGESRAVGRPDANSVSFEQLRSLGCSVTQAARILGSRGRIGGFDRPEAIDSVPGLPRALREDLKRRLSFAGAESATSHGGG